MHEIDAQQISKMERLVKADSISLLLRRIVHSWLRVEKGIWRSVIWLGELGSIVISGEL